MKDQSAMPKPGTERRSKYRHGAPVSSVQAITNAAIAHSEDMHSRMVKYAVTMGIRMVCLAAIFVFDGWFKLIPVIGAVVLPWVAVVIANGGADIVHQERVELLDNAPTYGIEGGQNSTEDDVSGVSDVLAGEIVPDEMDSPNMKDPNMDGPEAGEQAS
ncbi:DUF3099 domain-containing protein [Arthrobacter antibioticus]|uniref:DUF3099 domain-containing protein n=1 Tax=Arthrobacter sp. H35-MC1 TaxID=3046203 RepID=UPI0024B8F965|nr:DUF3099 domain-containing protein [Arthrobacter sp. H35-MC1]MDJ0315707.1 DUF3099 domain-containing protein [Arthrobacter sp. H35-MC1]